MVNQNQIKLLSDIDLLCHLCSIQDDHVAYEEFVNRFHDAIKTECLRQCKVRKLDKHIGIQIASDTFEKMRRHKTFRREDVKNLNSRKGVLAYLIRISVNLFNDYYRKMKKQDELVNHKTYFDDLLGPQGKKNDPVQLKEIKDYTIHIFKKLNFKEQKVILADVEYKKHQKYLPDDVNERLASEFGVKKDSIRKIRERAILKIKFAIDEFNKT